MANKGHNYGERRPVVLITGVSSGIGRCCAAYLAEKGYLVYGTSRKPAGSNDDHSAGLYETVCMDVNDSDSVNSAVDAVLQKTGQLDVVINNAGYGISGPVELTSVEEAAAQFDTNLFGIMRVCSAVLPIMREQQAGRIINISSLGGLIGLPYQGLYSATKFAVEGLSEALYTELHSLGIKVIIVEPGDFHTAFTKNRRLIAETDNDNIYSDDFNRALAVIESDENNGADPIKIARLIAMIIKRRNPRLRYRCGAPVQKLSVVLKSLLPARLFARLIMDHYK